MRTLELIRSGLEDWMKETLRDTGITVVSNYSDEIPSGVKAYHRVTATLGYIKKGSSEVYPITEVTEHYNNCVTTGDEAEANCLRHLLSNLFSMSDLPFAIR
jgi:hypothetical protein